MPLGRRRFAGLALPLLAAACVLARPGALHHGDQARARPSRRPARSCMLRDIGLASYLDRREIVRSSDGYKLDVMSNDWWGEPLGGMLGRVLVVGLSQRLPVSTVYGESGAISADPNATRRRQHPAPRRRHRRGTARSCWPRSAVEFNRPRRTGGAHLQISKPCRRRIAGLVAAISDAVGELADGIAALLQP